MIHAISSGMRDSQLATIQLEIDPESGYLCANERQRTVGIVTDSGIRQELTFGPSRKTFFLTCFKKHCPNVVKACHDVGISYTTYKQHYEVDMVFKEHVDSVMMEMGYNLKSYSFQLSMTKPAAFVDRMANLRVLLPDEYNPAHKVLITNNGSIDEPQARKRMDNLKGVIDAEIVRDSFRNQEEP